MTNQPPLTNQQLDDIETRAAALYEYATVADEEGQAEADRLTGTDVPALIADLRRARKQRAFLLDQIAKKDARSGEGDRALREFLSGEEQPDEVARLRAELAGERERYRAGLRRADEHVNAMSEEMKRYADGEERPVLWSVYNAMHSRAATAEARVAELETAMRQIRHLHKDSPMGPCPVCIDADAVAAGGDGLVPYPCPTGRLAGAQDCDPPSFRAARYAGDEITETLDEPAETDTLPAWLCQRFAVIHGCPPWDTLDDAERSYWEHQARAVRRAVARNGFKGAAVPAATEGAER